MLKFIQEYNKYVEITGYRSVHIENPEDFLALIRDQVPQGVEVQIFDATLVASWQHLYFAVLNALMAFGGETNVSNSFAVEVLRYASAQRQIKKAIELLGVKSRSETVAVILVAEKRSLTKTALHKISDHLNAKPSDSVLELSVEKVERVKQAFNLSDLALATVGNDNSNQALVNLVIEKVALLSTQV